MTSFFGDVDTPAIVMEHCRATRQKFTFEILDEDPRSKPEFQYVNWRELNWNHLGHLEAGDKISFQDVKGDFWCVFLSRIPRPVDRGGVEAVEKIMSAQARVRGE
jgi:hypothetical protein